MAARSTSELAKALIINTATNVSLPVMFNPEELKLEQGNTFAEVGIPGLDAPPVQYVRGKGRVLTMDLFFDTYGARTADGGVVDVRSATLPIVALLDKQPGTFAPPVLVFSMGPFQLQCVLVEAGQRFTMFARDGTPVRATLSVRFQEFVRVDVEVRRGLFFGSPTVSAVATAAVGAARDVLSGSSTVHFTIAGDTLSGLAAAFLGDPALWRDIARANDLDDPFDLPPGRPLVIPVPGVGRRR
ncbi:LysM domain-containing protein [Geodermatophilus saharensis]|uniref:LysM domain-containing protein n=1 Tax=Geodermatophilus saharensis TaxID=1137994 RepID=A0A239C791_9ACTN|nr:LysM peptidoglycan-binding domain-containing protein [Geodermatophilus saharensis]SNS15243.1 LysM domain-containing protein [Geodermatophilus saharensis]